MDAAIKKKVVFYMNPSLERKERLDVDIMASLMTGLADYSGELSSLR